VFDRRELYRELMQSIKETRLRLQERQRGGLHKLLRGVDQQFVAVPRQRFFSGQGM